MPTTALVADSRPLIVISGGTGVVGCALTGRLRAFWPEHGFVVLSRNPQPARTSPGLNPVFAEAYADVTLPGLGLCPHVRHAITARATVIVHCAADTRFTLTLDEARQANTSGTRHMLQLAHDCRRLQQFAHISTLYIAGHRAGPVPEAPLHHASGYVNTYEQSKHEAEALVLSQAQTLPVGIYRLSSVVEESGAAGHFRQVVRLIPWCNQFPFFPADPHVPVDLISTAWTASALATLITRHFTPGCIRHVCAGETLSMSVGSLMDRLFTAWQASTDAPGRRPRLIGLPAMERLGYSLPALLGPSPARALSSLMTFIPHLSIPQPFECAGTAALLTRSGHPLPDTEALLSQITQSEFQPARVVP